MNSNIVFCPHCGEELRYDGFNEQDGHSHYYCMGCDIEFTENEVTLLNFDPTDVNGFGFEEDENEEEFVPKPFMVIDTDEYGEVTLMPSRMVQESMTSTMRMVITLAKYLILIMRIIWTMKIVLLRSLKV